MSRGFGSLYYTDCRPGQGLQGGAGFQFQAASPGLAPEAMPIVQRTGLYEPPVRWMRERRPVAEYPPSLAHTAEGELFVTAAGRYLGQEANGTREGNQFTHAVVTRDPASYGVVRPAQLWAAPWWATEPAPDTELDELAEHPAPGLLDVETVRDRVRDAEGGQERLTALLSAIHRLTDPAHRRTVVLVCADPEQAACWIAAATLLVPQPQALRVSFKIFVADGQYGQHDIIALHPEWAGRWADTRSGSGLTVFDLDRGGHTAVEPTTAAGFWVPRFLAEDAYDVVDAVELAEQFAKARAAGAGNAQPTSTDRLAAAVVATGERLTAPGQLKEAADWLLTAPEDAMRIARDAVLEAMLDTAPPAPVLRPLAAAAGSRGWARAGAPIQRRLLTAEISETLAASDGVDALRMLTALPPLRVFDRPDEDCERARAEVEAALRGARPDQVPALLTVAHRHAVHPATATFRDAAYGFAAWWVQQPAPDLQPQRWPAPPEALDWVRDVLRGWLAGPHQAHAVAAVRTCWWRPLWPEACDPGDELDVQVMSEACQHLEGARWNRLMRDIQQWAFARMVGETHPSTVAWDIVFGARTPGKREAAEFLAGLVEGGRTVSPEVGSRLCAVLEPAQALSENILWMIDQLGQQGHSLPPPLAELHKSDQALLHASDTLRHCGSSATGAGLATALIGVAAPLLEVRAPIVVDSLLAAPRDSALAVLKGCSDTAAIPIYEALQTRLPRRAGTATVDECRALAFTFSIATGKPETDQQRTTFSALLDRLAELVAGMPEELRSAVERSYPSGLGQPWWDWVSKRAVSEREGRRWSLRHRSSARSGKPPGKRGE
ncbi:MAG: GTPase-associated protein 1-related protein [Pseudonocardiaceae bacterium]